MVLELGSVLLLRADGHDAPLLSEQSNPSAHPLTIAVTLTLSLCVLLPVLSVGGFGVAGTKNRWETAHPSVLCLNAPHAPHLFHPMPQSHH